MPQPIDIATLAAKVDQYVTLREKRRGLDRESERIKEKEEGPLRAELLKALLDSGAGSVGGTSFAASLVRKKVPTIADWAELKQHIKDTDSFELLQKRLSGPAVKEHWEAKKEIPGVVAIEVDDLSITKL